MKIVNFRLAPYLLLMLVAGIISASFNNLFINLSVIIISAIIPVFLFRKKLFRISIIGTIILILGISFTSIQLYISSPKVYEDVVINGRVTEDITYSGEEVLFYIDNLTVNNQKISGKTEINISVAELYYTTLENGDIITIRGNISRNELLPFDSYNVINYRNRVLYNAEIIEILGRESGDLRLDERIRAKLNNLINSSVSDEDAAGMAIALITGERKNISTDTQNNIATAGIAHIFAVSGMHIAILAGAIYFLLKKLKTRKIVNLIITSIILIFYAYICGFPPSINRAILMSVMVMFGSMSGRRNDYLSIICFSAVILLIINPMYLYDISFLMSYGAVIGIVLLYKPLNRMMSDLPNIVRSITITSISTNIVLFPVMSNYFNSFSIYFLIANLIILPFVSALYIILILGCIIGSIFKGLTFLISLSGFMLTGVRVVSLWIASLPFSVIAVSSMGFFTVFYYLSVILSSDYIIMKKEYSIKILIISEVLSVIGIIYAII